ncbi:MAG: NADH-quinone oxidoreductase subunit L, partial [Acidimicrobiales bacterium]
MAKSLPLLFVGWEGVGLCSYLLIGFWYKDIANAAAGKKAFIVNRVGDFAFLLGIFLMFWSFADAGAPSIAFRDMAANVGLVAGRSVAVPGWFAWLGLEVPAWQLLSVAGLLLFAGASGKSAQRPLHVWLPDAMAGPTPVSALIHAATMVAAGVFLVARMYPVFEASGAVLNEIGIIASITMLISALLALVQEDIKRVLAYSTVSQLAYMMAALSVGGYSAGVFHLVAHAFFKALLFLAAGAVIHAVHSNDMREMGGLARAMPVTFTTFLIGALALAGIAPLAGFWSKDEILTGALAAGFGGGVEGLATSRTVAQIVFVTGMLTVFPTALYVARMLWLTFGAAYR